MLTKKFSEKRIQGLHNQKTAHEEYWLLLAKVELSKFSEKSRRGDKNL
jgi:hypothetical protein